MTLPVLKFAPVFRDYLWGGRRLGEVLNKPIGDGASYAESWEVVDHGQDQSRVLGGPLEGKTLAQLVSEFGPDLVGDRWWQQLNSPAIPSHLRLRFPLLIKWLDANRDLSIQVHPNDQQAAMLDPPDLGKTEAWFIADAAPGARLYAGLKEGIDQAAFQDAVQRGVWLETLHSFEPQAGDCLFIPAGTVHALGAGLLVAEVQQASNTTYRLHDWGRVGPDGNPRPLHWDQAMEVIDFQAGPVHPIRCSGQPVQDLVRCPYFHWQRCQWDQPTDVPGGSCQIAMCVRGAATGSTGQGQEFTLTLGQTVLIPAEVPNWQIQPQPQVDLLIARLP